MKITNMLMLFLCCGLSAWGTNAFSCDKSEKGRVEKIQTSGTVKQVMDRNTITCDDLNPLACGDNSTRSLLNDLVKGLTKDSSLLTGDAKGYEHAFSSIDVRLSICLSLLPSIEKIVSVLRLQPDLQGIVIDFEYGKICFIKQQDRFFVALVNTAQMFPSKQESETALACTKKDIFFRNNMPADYLGIIPFGSYIATRESIERHISMVLIWAPSEFSLEGKSIWTAPLRNQATFFDTSLGRFVKSGNYLPSEDIIRLDEKDFEEFKKGKPSKDF